MTKEVTKDDLIGFCRRESRRIGRMKELVEKFQKVGGKMPKAELVELVAAVIKNEHSLVTILYEQKNGPIYPMKG